MKKGTGEEKGGLGNMGNAKICGLKGKKKEVKTNVPIVAVS